MESLLQIPLGTQKSWSNQLLPTVLLDNQLTASAAMISLAAIASIALIVGDLSVLLIVVFSILIQCLWHITVNHLTFQVDGVSSILG
ncbi:MAG: hypothetical protein ACFBSF_03815 [Leptolyngbyaceae cyanobacterium]